MLGFHFPHSTDYTFYHYETFKRAHRRFFLPTHWTCIQSRGYGRGRIRGHVPPPKIPMLKNRGFWLTHYCNGHYIAYMSSASGDTHHGSAPGPRWGDFCPQSPFCPPPKQISSYYTPLIQRTPQVGKCESVDMRIRRKKHQRRC